MTRSLAFVALSTILLTSACSRSADDEPPVPLDKPTSDVVYRFDCGQAGMAEFRYVGPDTLQLTFADATHILPSERAASGAKYSAGGVTFWNKSDEALIEVGEKRYSCTRN